MSGPFEISGYALKHWGEHEIRITMPPTTARQLTGEVIAAHHQPALAEMMVEIAAALQAMDPGRARESRP